MVVGAKQCDVGNGGDCDRRRYDGRGSGKVAIMKEIVAVVCCRYDYFSCCCL